MRGKTTAAFAPADLGEILAGRICLLGEDRGSNSSEALEAAVKRVGEDVKSGIASIRDDFGKRFDEQGARLDEHGKKIDDVEAKLKSLEEDGKKSWVPGLADTKEAKQFSLAKIAGYVIDPSQEREKHAGLEIDICKEAAKAKDFSVLAPTQAGMLIPPEVLVGEFIDSLKAASIVRALGARVIGGQRAAEVRIPRKTSSSTVKIKTEGQAAEATDFKVGELSFRPKAATAYVPVTNLLLMMDTNPDVDSMIISDLTEEIALIQDLKALRGAGHPEPLGIINDPDVPTPNSGAGAAAVDYDRLANLYAEPIIQNANRFGSFAWAFHGLVYKELIKLVTTDGLPIFRQDPSMGQPATSILGSPWEVSNQLGGSAGNNDGEIIYGSWPQLLLLEWGGLMIERSNQATAGGINAFTQGYTFIKATRWFDAGVRQPKAFSVDTQITIP